MDLLFRKPVSSKQVSSKQRTSRPRGKRLNRQAQRQRMFLFGRILAASLCCVSLAWVLSGWYLDPELSEVWAKEKVKLASRPNIKEVHNLLETACGVELSRKEISSAVYEASKRYLLEPELIAAVIVRESACNAQASSAKGAGGLMQIMPETARDLGLKNRFSPRDNILAGSKYLSYLLKEFDGDLNLALAAYNAGPQSVKKHGGVPPYRETRRYVKKVINTYKKLSA